MTPNLYNENRLSLQFSRKREEEDRVVRELKKMGRKKSKYIAEAISFYEKHKDGLKENLPENKVERVDLDKSLVIENLAPNSMKKEPASQEIAEKKGSPHSEIPSKKENPANVETHQGDKKKKKKKNKPKLHPEEKKSSSESLIQQLLVEASSKKEDSKKGNPISEADTKVAEDVDRESAELLFEGLESFLPPNSSDDDY